MAAKKAAEEILNTEKKTEKEEPILNKQVLDALQMHAQNMAKIALDSNGSGMDLVKDIKVMIICYQKNLILLIILEFYIFIIYKYIIDLWGKAVSELNLKKFYPTFFFNNDKKKLNVNKIKISDFCVYY